MNNETLEVQLKVTGANQFQGDLRRAQGNFSKTMSGIAGVAKVAAGAVMAVGAAAFAVGASAVKSAAQIEQQEIAFKTLLGSAEDASRVLNQIKEDAKKTPFQFEELVSLNQLLIGTFKDPNIARGVIMAMGNVTAAFGKGSAELQRMGNTLTQVYGKGKADAMDFRELVNAGWSTVREDTAKAMGVSIAQLGELITAGEVGFTEINKALQSVGGEGGRFGKAMEEQALSFNGIVSNIIDTWKLGMADFARSSGLFDIMKTKAETFQKSLSQAFGIAELFVTGDFNKKISEMLGGIDEDTGLVASVIGIRNKVIDFGNRIKSVFTSVRTIIVKFGTAFSKHIAPIKEMITTLLLPSIKELRGAFEKMFSGVNKGDTDALIKFLADMVAFFVKVGVVVATVVIKVFTSVIEILTKIQMAFKWLIENGPTILQNAWNSVMAFFTNIVNYVKSIPDMVASAVTAIGEWFKQLPTMLLEALGAMIAHIVVFITDTINYFLTLPDRIAYYWEAIKIVAIDTFNKIKQNIITFIESLPGIWEQMKTNASENFELLKTNIKTKVDEIKKFFSEDFPNGVKTGVDKIKGFFESLPGTLAKVLNSIISKFEKAVNAVIKGYNSVAEQSGIPKMSKVALPRLQNGGIIGGSSMSGDNVLVRANAGEMYINRQDQQSLFSFIKNLTSQPRINNYNITGNNFGGNRSPMQQENNFVNLLTNIA